MTDTIPTLSIRQPWAWAICHAGKRCENREWDPRGGNVGAAQRLIAAGGRLLIHAGKGCTRDEYEDASYAIDLAVYRQDVVPPLRALPRGFLVARARLVDMGRTSAGGHRWRWWQNRTCLLCCGSVPSEDRAQTTCPKADPWAIPGSVALVLADVEPLAKPLSWSGALGFFNVPTSVLA